MLLASTAERGGRAAVEPVRPRAHANRVLYAHNGLSGWFANGQRARSNTVALTFRVVR